MPTAKVVDDSGNFLLDSSDNNVVTYTLEDLNLVGHWPCQDNAASTTVVGLVGGNATIQNSVNSSTLSVEGPGGNYPLALSINTTAQRIVTTLQDQHSGNFTACWWMYLESGASGSKRWFSTGGTGADSVFIQQQSSGVTLFRWQNSGGTSVSPTSTGTLSNTTWYHIAIVRDGTTCKFAINGVFDDTTTTLDGPIGSSANAYIFGTTGAFEYPQCRIADLRTYTRALSTTDLARISSLGITSNARSTNSLYIGPHVGI